MGSSRGRSRTALVSACTKCEQIKRSPEIVLFLTLAGSDVLVSLVVLGEEKGKEEHSQLP